MDPSQHEFRALFLREFVKQIINNYPLSPESMHPSEEMQLPQEGATVERIQFPVKKTTAAEIQTKEYTSSPPLNGRKLIEDNAEYSTAGPQMIVAIREIDDMPAQPSATPLRTTIQPQPATTTLQQGTSFEQWLYDQTLESIECSGPNQELIVKRNGMITKIPNRYTEEEIKKIVKELSEKSRIPIEKGILKAETPSWSAIAVISEFGGSRFLIQKRKQSSNARSVSV